jgi:SAM-dependent methyltransferase
VCSSDLSEPRAWIYGDHVPDPTRRDLVGLKANWIIRRIAAQPRTRVLDYGCGEGKHLRLIRQFDPDATRVGVDIRPMHTKADFEFHQLEPAGSLPFTDSSFDVIISCDVLEHVASIEHSLDEIRRVLRPGGAFIGFVPLEGGLSPHSFFRIFSPDLYRDTKDHVRYLTNREMRGLLSARFRIIRLEYSYHLFGACMDAAFFASFKFPGIGWKIADFWRGMANPFYHQSREHPRPSIFGRVMMFGNTLAYYESAIFRNVSVGACGLHFHVEKPT